MRNISKLVLLTALTVPVMPSCGPLPVTAAPTGIAICSESMEVEALYRHLGIKRWIAPVAKDMPSKFEVVELVHRTSTGEDVLLEIPIRETDAGAKVEVVIQMVNEDCSASLSVLRQDEILSSRTENCPFWGKGWIVQSPWIGSSNRELQEEMVILNGKWTNLDEPTEDPEVEDILMRFK